jgi:26S proteasome regulatory subunit N13
LDSSRAAASTATATDAAARAVKNLLDSLKAQGFGAPADTAEEKYPHLTHLLPSETTLPVIETASEEYVDTLLGLLPPTIVILAAGFGTSGVVGEPSPDVFEAARDSMELDAKKTLLRKVARSPQFHQSLASLSLALRDGGLPGVADALGIKVENGGYMKGGAMPLGGGDAIRAFVEGAKKTVEDEE